MKPRYPRVLVCGLLLIPAGFAFAQQETGEAKNAIQRYTEAIRLNPENAEAHMSRGNAWFDNTFPQSIPGEWESRSDFAEGQKGEANYAFYDRSHGSLMHVQRYPSGLDANPATQDDFLQAMQEAESFWGERPHPRFARLLANEFFVPPDRYYEANDPYVKRALTARRAVSTLYIWNMKDIEGDAHLFYVSQLTPRIATALKIATSPTGEKHLNLHVAEEYVPLRMTRAERTTIGSGEALVLELETKKPAVKRAISRFKMPASIRGQRIRYGLVIYGAKGFGPDPPIRIIYATPVGSGLNHTVVLNALNQSQ